MKFFPMLLISGLAVFLMCISSYLGERGASVTDGVSKVSQACSDGNIGCGAISSILKEIHNSGSATKRKDISKDDLPVVRIYMNDGAVKKLDNKRKSVLAKPRPIHIAESRDWVKATIVVQYSDREERSKVSLRLKGDWGDHLEDPKKLSFRIKTRSGGYLFGMKSFSIQHPVTRNYGNEPLIMSHMRDNDILSPRYQFTDVYINEFPIGVMALEEHFRKEMIEAQERRDGPILALDEDPLWAQWDINRNSRPVRGKSGYNFSSIRDATIKDFNGSDFERGTIPTNNARRGQALFRDFLDGKVSPQEAFDYEKLSRYWILVNIWGGCHANPWHNKRLYFNPISGLLEPISFDNIPRPEAFKVCYGYDTTYAARDPKFLNELSKAAEDIYEQLQSPEFHAKITKQQEEHARFFRYEGFDDSTHKLMSPEILTDNLLSFLTAISKKYPRFKDASKSYVVPPKGLIKPEFLALQKNLHLHLTAFYYPDDEASFLEFRNLTLNTVSLQSVYVSRKKGDTVLLNIKDLGDRAKIKSGEFVKLPLDVSDDVLNKNSEFVIDYVSGGKAFSRPVFVKFKNASSGFAADAMVALSAATGPKAINVDKKQIVFKTGVHNFDESIELPEGWGLDVSAGAVINFKNGALLKLRGPLNIKGTIDKPVHMNVESRLDFKDMGSWGGLFVSKSTLPSSVDFLILEGTGVQNLNTRQGFYGMTGCMSFFESDVIVKNSIFKNAQCEDALNIVKADFTLDNIVIEGARADAFDSDFSTGQILNSKFLASGNDGVDVSGTSLTLKDISMENIGDKAISVGEKSSLVAEDIYINGAVLGLVSKDRSDATASRVRFENISSTAIMTYIKKQEYGPSTAECNACDFIGDIVRTGAQETTEIKLDNSVIYRNSLSKKQMYDAGLLEGDG